jgi:hypothetical protein
VEVEKKMPTPFESAELNLKLFELRRDPVLREARAWFLSEFNPQTFEEFTALAWGERNAWVRMVLGYWDMAASLVTFGAIDADMFLAAHTEIVATFAKVEPFVAEIRRVSGIAEFLSHLEAVVRGMPGSEERLATLQKGFRAMAEVRRAADAQAVRPRPASGSRPGRRRLTRARSI